MDSQEDYLIAILTVVACFFFVVLIILGVSIIVSDNPSCETEESCIILNDVEYCEER